jgi:hypothetical protein
LWQYTTGGWFLVLDYPGGRPHYSKHSIIEAYENPPPSKRYPYRGTRLIDPEGVVPEPLEADEVVEGSDAPESTAA